MFQKILQNKVANQNINDGVIKPTVSATSGEDDHSKTEDSNSLDDNQYELVLIIF